MDSIFKKRKEVQPSLRRTGRQNTDKEEGGKNNEIKNNEKIKLNSEISSPQKNQGNKLEVKYWDFCHNL